MRKTSILVPLGLLLAFVVLIGMLTEHTQMGDVNQKRAVPVTGTLLKGSTFTDRSTTTTVLTTTTATHPRTSPVSKSPPSITPDERLEVLCLLYGEKDGSYFPPCTFKDTATQMEICMHDTGPCKGYDLQGRLWDGGRQVSIEQYEAVYRTTPMINEPMIPKFPNRD